ncbi:hypothetical protein [Kitasatospora sp. NPDC001527]|uniref:hypothetical protein n=1 Tax=Kitasatospora sp. NPDC001527 TaxID=3154519 RepID=UPI00332F70B6
MPRPPAAAGPIRRRAGLLSFAPVLAFPLVLLVAAEAGELNRPDVPVLQSAAGLWQPLTVTPTSAAAPSATPASTATAVPVPAAPTAPPAADPAAAEGDRSEPDAEAVPSTAGTSSKRPRPTRPSTGAARPPARPAQPAPAPPAGGPVVPLPGGGSGGLCTAAQQAGQLPPSLLQLCHSMYG